MPLQATPLARAVIGCAIRIHRALGPGLFESAYQRALTHELTAAGIGFEREVALPIVYKGVTLDCGFRVDFIIDRQLLLEIKSVEKLAPIHSAQVLTYLRISGVGQALLIDFNVSILRHGIKSFLWRPPEKTMPLAGITAEEAEEAPRSKEQP